MSKRLSNDGFVIFDVIECDAQNVAYKSFAGIQSVLCLVEIVCVLTVVNIILDFVHAWQWMQYLHVVFAFAKHVGL